MSPHEEKRHLGCQACVYFEDDGEVGDYGGYLYHYYICAKEGQEHFSNLKRFPFKNAPAKCFQLEFWCSEFPEQMTKEDYELPIVEMSVYKAFIAKYHPERVKQEANT